MFYSGALLNKFDLAWNFNLNVEVSYAYSSKRMFSGITSM